MTKQYSSDPKGRKFLSLTAFILTVIILAALNVLRLYVNDKFPQYMPDTEKFRQPEQVIIAIMIILAAVYVVFIVILLPMWYKTIKYTIKDDEIVSRSGLFSRTYRIMKISAIEHASRISLPLAKYTCFNFISVHALGGSMMLMFLSTRDCAEIIHRLERELGIAKARKKTPKLLAQSPPEIFAAAPPAKSKYSLADADGISLGKDYVYTDNSSLLTPEELSDILDDYSANTQLTFSDLSSTQLSFNDLDKVKEKQSDSTKKD